MGWDPIPGGMGSILPRGSVRGSREQVESVGRSWYLSDRDWGVANEREVPVGACTHETDRAGWMGTTGRSAEMVVVQLVIGNGDREVGSGNSPPCVQFCRELGVGWQEIWEGGIGTPAGLVSGGVASCLCGLVSSGHCLCPWNTQSHL